MLALITREKTALLVSAMTAGLFAVVGISWGLWIDSMIILFDGSYSLISLGLSLLSVYAAQAIKRPADSRYPFGRAAMEPLVIAIKGTAILLICIISLFSAAAALVSGGREVNAEMAMLFATASVSVCLVVGLYLRGVQRHNPSGLILAEKRQWLMDTLLSAAVLAGFAIAYGLQQHPQWAPLAVYADPVMVLLICSYFIRVPIKMMRGAMRELIMAAPDNDLQHHAQQALRNAGLASQHARLTKVGPYLIIDLDLPASRVCEFGRLRFAMYRQLSGLSVRPVVFLNVADKPMTDHHLEVA